MENNALIQDTGLFIGQKIFDFSLTESFESITNLYQTIKEYREFANPDNDAWFEYIHQIFQIFGFNTVKISPRLITLQEMSENQTPKALVCIIGPNEDFSQINYGVSWDSYLFYAAKYHQLEWVILTNGLQFKVLNYGDNWGQQKYFQCELDEIIKNEKTDSFFTLYKTISVINNFTYSEKAPQKNSKNHPKKQGEQVLMKRHHLRKEFWTQLITRSKGKTKLFVNKTPGIYSYISIGAGKTGIGYSYNISYHAARVDLYIDNGDASWNKRVFDTLISNKADIEKAFGNLLSWERLENKRASVIRFKITQSGLQNKENWPNLQDEMIEAMIKLEGALHPYIQQLN
ncbi:MAG: DUF4268 domain-containing protein [Anaerolineaceae bacterium]|nr:DUF4268 domain-containing protein [Anaerolineaceae bacterium]